MPASIIDIVLHLDKYIAELTQNYGLLTYVILFLIIFAETGLVIFPFLPGDSLLFAAGAIASLGGLNIVILIIVLSIAAILGDTVNYWIGHFFGEQIVRHPKLPLKQSHLDKTHKFYKKYGAKTIVLARFVPIVRTFAPFVAGIGAMNYKTFITYNIFGGILWVSLFTLAGYFFGNIPTVKHNFTLVILAIIALSVLPILFEWFKAKRNQTKPSTPINTSSKS